MKNIILIFIFSILFNFSSAQIFKKKEERHKLEFGIPSPQYFSLDLNFGTLGKFYYHDFIFQPHFSYYPTKNIGFGISADINFSKSNFTEIPKKYGFGFFYRLYLPVKFSPKFFDKLDFFIEFRIEQSNYYFPIDEKLTTFHEPSTINGLAFSEPIVFESLKQTTIKIPLGIKYEIFRNLHFQFSPELVFNYHDDEYIGARIGLDYYFITNKKKIKKNKRKEKNTDFINSFIIGSSFTYYNSGEYIQTQGDTYSFNYYLWNFNVSTSINKSLFIGIQTFNFFTKNADNENKHYSLVGFFSQLDILRGKRNRRIFFDLSLNNSNINFDFEKGPDYKKNTFYAGAGFGFDIPLKFISKHLYFDLSGYRYVPLKNSNLGYAFNQYVLGLNYHFGKRVKTSKQL